MAISKPRLRRRGDSWVVDCGRVYRPDGSWFQDRKSYRTQAEAKTAMAAKNIDAKNKVVNLTNVPEAERTDFLKARELLAGSGISLEQAALFYMKHGRPVAGTVRLEDMATEYIESKITAGRRPGTITDLRVKVGRFVRDIEKEYAHEVMTADVEGWLNSQGFTSATWDSYRRAVVGLFNYAVKRKYVAENPALPIEAVEFDQAVPEVMDVTDVRKILNTAKEHYPEMVPHFAIGFFCGLRKAELEGLRWENVLLDAEEPSVTVTPATAKKRRMRHVSIPENALEWITPFWKPSGSVPYSRRHFRKVRELAGVEWVDNGMRHSFASYHLAHHEDPAKTSLLLGHQRPDVLFSNYRNIRTVGGKNITKKLAASYWDIRPADTGNVIPLANAAGE